MQFLLAAHMPGRLHLAAQETMKQLASSPRLIVPGHDPEVMTRYPKVAEGVVEIK